LSEISGQSDRKIRETVDEDCKSTVDRSAVNVYDGQNLLLQFDRSGSENMVYEDLSHRYMHARPLIRSWRKTLMERGADSGPEKLEKVQRYPDSGAVKLP
jgi:hypothetical protein